MPVGEESRAVGAGQRVLSAPFPTRPRPHLHGRRSAEQWVLSRFPTTLTCLDSCCWLSSMMAIIFLASRRAEEKPSENIMISPISVKSGTIMDTGRRMDCGGVVLRGTT